MTQANFAAIGPEVRFTARDGVVASDMGQDWALLDLETNDYYTLNPTGAHIWVTIQNGGATKHELVAALTEQFDVDETACEQDVAIVLGQLLGAKLIAQQTSADDPG